MVITWGGSPCPTLLFKEQICLKEHPKETDQDRAGVPIKAGADVNLLTNQKPVRGNNICQLR